MPKLLLRRALLLSLVATSASFAFDGYRWRFDGSMPVCEAVVWKQVPRESLKGLCMDSLSHGEASTTVDACVMECLVVSAFSEEEAKRIRERGGESLYVHEVRDHIQRRMRHQ